jgi:hypothetical protein
MTAPSYPVTLLKVSYYISGLPPGAAFVSRVLDFDGIPSTDLTEPITIAPDETGWLEVNMEDQGVEIQSGFCVAMFREGDTAPSFGTDSNDNGRAWEFDGSTWSQEPGTFFMRATVQTGLSVDEDPHLVSFTTDVHPGFIDLLWEIQQDWEIYACGFNVYRAPAPESGSMTRLNRNVLGDTVYRDQTVSPGETYYYWVEIISHDGLGTLHGPARATAELLPESLVLLDIRPLPASDHLILSYYVPADGEASFSLYDFAGRQVIRKVQHELAPQGLNEMMWNFSEASVAPGAYLCRVIHQTAGKKAVATRPVVITR